MYDLLKSLHSFLPYVLLTALVIAIIIFFTKKAGGKEFNAADKRLALITLILAHLQLVFGLLLYFISPVVKAALQSGAVMADAANRFWAVEHIATMLIAIVLITVGYSRAKRKTASGAKFKTLAIFYLLGLILALLRIPWELWPA